MSWIQSDIYWICDVTTWGICATLNIIILIIHLFKVGQDLLTKERKSVDHLPQKPDINRIYVITTICSTLSISMFGMELLLGCLGNLHFMASRCNFTAVWGPGFWQIAKCALYLMLLLRLHTVYKGSQYQYNPKTLFMVGIFTIIINTFWVIALNIFAYSDGYKQYEVSNVAIVCNIIVPEFLLYGTAAYDVIMSCSCLFCFISPLKKLIESIPDPVRSRNNDGHSEASKSTSPATATQTATSINSNKTKKSKKRKKSHNKTVSRHIAHLTTVGLKFLIVTMAAVVSSLLMLIFVAVTDAFIVGAYDFLVNSVCIVLMTPYYDDTKYYNRLCFCCIHCCRNCKYHGMNGKLEIVTNRITRDLSVSTTTGTEKQSTKRSEIVNSSNVHLKKIQDVKMDDLYRIDSVSAARSYEIEDSEDNEDEDEDEDVP